MKTINRHWFHQNLGLDFSSTSDEIWIQNGRTLRRIIGILGMSLPLLLWLFLYLTTAQIEVLESISHYYYTRSDGPFLIIIGIMAIFLIIFKGPDLIDFILSSLAGICAFLLLLFPTQTFVSSLPNDLYSYSNTILPINESRELFHYITAGIFLSSLALMSIFLFTKSDCKKRDRTPMKRFRNRIYIVCGIVMILSLALIPLGSNGIIISEEYYRVNNLTFWMETTSVEAFGFSWLVKGETIFKDKTS